MNIIFGTRGDVRNIREMIEQINWHYLPTKWNKTNKDGTMDIKGKPEIRLLTPSLKPVMLWDLQVPEEYRDLILTTLFTEQGQEKYQSQQKYIKWFRKIMGLKSMPKEMDKTKKFPWRLDHTDFVFIGIKEDGKWENGVEKL